MRILSRTAAICVLRQPIAWWMPSTSTSIRCIVARVGMPCTVRLYLLPYHRSTRAKLSSVSFSAAIVLLASLKCPLVDCQVGDEKFESCWARCMAVFEHYRDQIQSAPHIILLLRAIRRQMTQGSEAGMFLFPNFLSHALAC